MDTLRNDIIKLAHSNPELRAQLVPLLKTARVFGSPEEMQNYLKKHPNADKTKHKVIEPKAKDSPKEKEDSKGKYQEDKYKEDPKPKGGFFAQIADKFKGVKDSVLATIKKSPEHVQQYISDPKFRKEISAKMIATAQKSPKVLITKVLHAVHHEYKENKHGFKALRKLASKGKLDKADKKALYSLGAYIAGTALATIPPGGVIAGLHAVGHSFMAHVGLKAVHHAVDNGFLHFEWLESVLHVAHVVAADNESEPSDDELIARLTGHVFDALKSLDDEDMATILKGSK